MSDLRAIGYATIRARLDPFRSATLRAWAARPLARNRQ
jgi:hypothetical protein